MHLLAPKQRLKEDAKAKKGEREREREKKERKKKEAFSKALNAAGRTLIAVPIKHQIRPIVPLIPEEA
jgi:thiamine pyrophosphate-dependent acetolactate synthase large subunit-like protein